MQLKPEITAKLREHRAWSEKKIEFARKRGQDISEVCREKELTPFIKKYLSNFLKSYCYRLLPSKTNEEDKKMIGVLRNLATK